MMFARRVLKGWEKESMIAYNSDAVQRIDVENVAPSMPGTHQKLLDRNA